MRWRQIDGKLVPIDEAAARKDAGISLNAKFVPYRSHVDGTLIFGPKSLREHNKRNDVVQVEEFGDKHYERAQKKRDDFYLGNHTTKESFARKQEIYEHWITAERNQ